MSIWKLDSKLCTMTIILIYFLIVLAFTTILSLPYVFDHLKAESQGSNVLPLGKKIVCAGYRYRQLS